MIFKFILNNVFVAASKPNKLNWIIKNVSSFTSHKKNPSLCLSVFTSVQEFNSVRAETCFWVNLTLSLMLSPNHVSSSQPDSHQKRGGRFPFLLFDETQFFLRLSMISWGQFYVMQRFCDFLNVTIFCSNYNLNLCSYGHFFVLVLYSSNTPLLNSCIKKKNKFWISYLHYVW